MDDLGVLIFLLPHKNQNFLIRGSRCIPQNCSFSQTPNFVLKKDVFWCCWFFPPSLLSMHLGLNVRWANEMIRKKKVSFFFLVLPFSLIPVLFNQRLFHLPHYPGDERNSSIKKSRNMFSGIAVKFPTQCSGNPCHWLQHCFALKNVFPVT